MQGGADTLLLSQGEVTGIGIARFQKQHSGQRLQLRLNPNAKQGPPPVGLLSFMLPSGGSALWLSFSSSKDPGFKSTRGS